ncbi:MAG TPA: polysaccharide biosynthesis tyrosine autokinase [Bryobacteraceae bacterium]|nr:polysaccharide biosynthesis tyrosine autokinase [Bryobacteraceae bacterium]
MSLTPQPWQSPNLRGRDPHPVHMERRVEDLLAALESTLTAGPSAADHPTTSLATYGRALKRHRFALAFVALVCAAGAWFLSNMQDKVYQAHTTLELLEPNRSLMNMQNFTPGGNSILSQEVYMETQVNLLRSESLLSRVRHDLEQEGVVKPVAAALATQEGIAPEDASPVSRSKLNVSPIRDTRLINLTYDAYDPKLAARILNAITAAYIQEDVNVRVDNTEQTQHWLQKQLEDTKAKLEASESNLQKYAKSSGLLYTSPKGQVAEQTEDKLQFLAQDLSQSQAKLADLQAKYEIAKSKAAGAPVSADNPTVRDLETRLADLRRQRAALNSTFTPEYFKVQETDAAIQEVQANLEKEYARWVKQLGDAYAVEQRHENLLQSAYNQQAGLVGDQAYKAIHYNVLKREVETNRNLYDALLAGMKEAGVNAAARVNNARVVDSAQPPRLPYRPTPERNAIIGLISGLMLASVFALARESSDRRVKAPGIVPTYLNIPELGVIPTAKPYLLPTAYHDSGGIYERQRNGIIGDRRSRSRQAKFSPIQEAFHAAVTSILSASRTEAPPKVVVVTSGAPHEGKSTVIGNLAMIAAQIGRRVLLIDGDLRNPRQHHIYGVSNKPGLSDLLRTAGLDDEALSQEVVKPTSVRGLSLLPSGTKSDQVATLLHSQRLSELMEQLRDEFDLILIDTPPVLPFADARVFGRVADAVVLVVRSGQTTRQLAQAAQARFIEDGVPVFGTILNDWNGKESSYYQSHYAYPG